MRKLQLSWVPVLLLGLMAVFVILAERNGPPDEEKVAMEAASPAGLADNGESSSLPAENIPDEALPQEYITFWARIGEVDFPHDMHVDDFGMECEDCHHETNAALLDIPHEEYFDDFWIDCSSCHNTNGETFSDPQSCSNCHHADPVGVADETLSSKVVLHKLCWECHDSGTGVDATESCTNCHFGDRTSFIEPLPESQRNQ